MEQDIRGQRIVVIVMLSLLFLASAGIGVFMLIWSPKPLGPLTEVPGTSAVRTTRTLTPVVVNAPAGWREKFDAVYTLADGQFVKRIPPPWIPERDYFYKTEYASQAAAMPDGPSYITFRLINGKLQRGGMGFSGTNNFRRPLSSVAQSVGGLRPYQMELDSSASQLDLSGDYIVREPATQKQKLDDLAKIISEMTSKKYQFVEQKRQRDVVLVTGTYTFTPKADAPDKTAVHLYGDSYDPDGRESNYGTTSVQNLLDIAGQLRNVPVINEANVAAAGTVKMHIHQSAYNSGANGTASLEKLLANLADQTGLKFDRVQREMPVWTLVEGN
jgi:hypothetical protein